MGWVNVGFAYDATFKSAPGRFAVGDEIVGLEIVSADVKRNRLAIKITNDTRLKSRTPEEQARRRGNAKSTQGSSIPASTKKAASSTFTKAAGAPASDAAAATARPAGGWHHAGGRNI